MIGIDAHEGGVFALLWGNVVVVFSKVVRVDVMSPVAGLPREVGRQESGVRQPSNGVVHIIVCREPPVSTFVANDLMLYLVSVR